MADPWFKFYPADWRQDPALRMCSLGARGLWIEMIALMHQATPYGQLLISGQSPTDAQLAMLVGCPSEQVTQFLGELEAAGVFSRTRSGAIYSRKMSRMQKKAATARNNGMKGGNPSLCKTTDNPPLDNQKDKAEDKPQNQKPDTRVVREEGKPSSWPFSLFWADWPHKQNKAAAETAWRKVPEDDRKAAISSIGPWFSWWQGQNPQASPIHAATYLNKRRWTDERTVRAPPIPQHSHGTRLFDLSKFGTTQ